MIAADRVGAILLAAGESRRFGEADKLLADLDGRPLARHVAERLAGLGLGALIAICSNDDVAELLADAGFMIVRNDMPSKGLSRSLALGVTAAATLDIDAALLCLADMPDATASHLRALLTAFDAERAPIVASELRGEPMPPALFGKAHFPALRAQTGDRGARDLLHLAMRVPATPATLADVDTPEDLLRRSLR